VVMFVVQVLVMVEVMLVVMVEVMVVVGYWVGSSGVGSVGDSLSSTTRNLCLTDTISSFLFYSEMPCVIYFFITLWWNVITIQPGLLGAPLLKKGLTPYLPLRFVIPRLDRGIQFFY